MDSLVRVLTDCMLNSKENINKDLLDLWSQGKLVIVVFDRISGLTALFPFVFSDSFSLGHALGFRIPFSYFVRSSQVALKRNR